MSRLEPMNQAEKARLRSAAFKATCFYPGAVGVLLSREILAWEEFGYRLGVDRTVMMAVDQIMNEPILAELPANVA